MFKSLTKESVKLWVKKIFASIINPRFLLCFLLAWMITNGWCYVLLGVGFVFDIAWMKWLAGTYLAFLWLPFTPEKIITIPVAIFLLRLLFPKDEKTLGVLREMHQKAKDQFRRKRTQRKEKHRQRTDSE